jgi:hypothetical protein
MEPGIARHLVAAFPEGKHFSISCSDSQSLARRLNQLGCGISWAGHFRAPILS